MASLTRADMISRVLERLGVSGVGRSPSAEDSALAGEVLDSIYSQYRKKGMAPFATSAWPDWAQTAFVKIAAADAARYFGVPNIQEMELGRQQGDLELAEQMSVKRHQVVRARYY